jgi:thiol-disulfide isomerase/thioredoxin
VDTKQQRPSFEGASDWFNSSPLQLPDLRGNVVLVDFWTLTCINWLRTVPFLRRWWELYENHGLVIVGVHTPEFSFENNVEYVAAALDERKIRYPVAVDNEYAVWNSFGNRYWPALYVLDESGVVREYHPGEERYWQPERVIQHLLGIEHDLIAVTGTGVEAAADWASLRSPETYLGYLRGTGFASPGGATPDKAHRFDLPKRLRLNHWGLVGEWTIDEECARLNHSQGSIAFRFHARDAHVVLSRRAAEPIPFRVTLDGAAPGISHGVDVDDNGVGLLDASRLYQLVRQRDDVRTQTLELQFDAPGAEAYAFTFG